MKSNANLVLGHIIWRGMYFLSVLLLNILIARFFAAEKSGQIFFIVNNLSIIILIFSLSLESGSIYFISSGKLEAVQMGNFLILWTLASGILAVLTGWVFLGFAHLNFLKSKSGMAATTLFIFGVLLTTFFNALYYSKKQFLLPNKILLIVNIQLAFFLVAGNHNQWIRTHFLLMFFSSYFIQGFLLLITFFIRYKKNRVNGLPSAPTLNKVVRYSSVALLANLIYFLVNRMDYWFVERYCHPTDLGNYIQASKMIQMMLIIPSTVSSTLFPLIVAGNVNNASFYVRVLFWLNMFCCLVFILTGYWLFPFVFGASFNNMYFIFVLLVPGLLCLTANYPLTAYNSGNNLISRNTKGSILALIIIGTGDIFILPALGVMSAAIISSLGYLSYYLYILYYYRKNTTSRFIDFFIIRKADLKSVSFELKKLMGVKPDARRHH